MSDRHRLAAVVAAVAFLLALVMAVDCGVAYAADPTVNAVSPGGMLSPPHPTAVVPVTLTRTSTVPIAGFSVRFQLTNLTLSSVALGGFLAASGGTPSSAYVTSLGGGVYVVDATTLGAPCGSGATAGTLFDVTVGAPAGDGVGTLTITQVLLRNCGNAAIPVTIGTNASMERDFAGPTVTCTPTRSGALANGCQLALPDLRLDLNASDFHGPVTVTQTPAPGTLLGPGTVTVTFVATDQLGHGTNCTTAFTASDVTSPLTTLNTPNGGESWLAGTSHTATWSGSDNCSIVSFDLELSLDSGAHWTPIVTSQAYAGGMPWNVPNTPTTHARLRVRLRDAAGNTATDASNADWTIRPSNQAPVLAPIGNRVSNELVPLTFTAGATDPDVGQALTYTLDPGAPSGATIDATSGVFTWTPSESQGPGVYTITVRVTDNGSPALDAFETITITVNEVDLAPVTLTAAPVLAGNDLDGTTRIRLTWTPPSAGTSVAIYRKGYGGYPRYDDVGGAVPPPPAATYPPLGWTLAGTTSGASFDDDPPWPGRDFCYYVAYVIGPGSNVSPPSNRTAGTLDYRLGDVMNPPTPGNGDNSVDLSDVSLLGSHYGLAGGALTPYDYLDVGPTSTGFVDGRPLTDGRVDFEDLMILSINYGSSSSAIANDIDPESPATELVQGDRVWIDVPTEVTAGGTFTARVRMSAAGLPQGVSVTLFWDGAVAEPTGATTGAWLTGQNGVMFTPQPGTIDAALLGVHATGLTGEGVLADVTFSAIATGNPRIGIRTVIARDALNRSTTLTPLAVTAPAGGGSTALAAPAPNPFRRAAQLSFRLAVAGPTELAMYSVDGRRVRTLANGPWPAGDHRLSWDGCDDQGRRLQAGIYYARLTTPDGRTTRTVALLH